MATAIGQVIEVANAARKAMNVPGEFVAEKKGDNHWHLFIRFDRPMKSVEMLCSTERGIVCYLIGFVDSRNESVMGNLFDMLENNNSSNN